MCLLEIQVAIRRTIVMPVKAKITKSVIKLDNDAKCVKSIHMVHEKPSSRDLREIWVQADTDKLRRNILKGPRQYGTIGA